MTTERLTKQGIAERQLFHAIDLYMEGVHLLSVITLAGAAEEILGKMLSNAGEKNAFTEKVDLLIETSESVIEEPIEPKEFAKIINSPRNELKHLCEGDDVELELDAEAARMIHRAIANHRKLFPGSVARFIPFRKESVRRWEERNEYDA